MEKKKSILMVSFGTSHLDTMEKTIAAIEKQAAEEFPEYQVYRAFTSQMVLNKLKREHNLEYHNVRQAVEQMKADGIETVIAQPTHVINGIESDKMVKELLEHMDAFKRIRIGKPLLSKADDYKKAIHALIDEVEVKEDEMLVLMGHGSDHHANSAYPTLEYTFHSMGYNHVLVGTVEGFPDLGNVMTKLEISESRKVVLLPFMVVAGDHAKNDMAGEEDSWKAELEDSGYEVRAIVKGLGEMSGIRNLFMEHIKEVI